MSFDTGQSATNIHKMFLSARICFPPRLTSRARFFPFPSAISVDAVGPLSLPPPSFSLPLTCPPGRVRKDGGGDPPIFDAVVGGGGILQETVGSCGVGCLGFPWRRLLGISFPFFFLLLFLFVFDPSAGCCIVMTLMIVTDG